jgi:hypothetical protein
VENREWRVERHTVHTYSYPPKKWGKLFFYRGQNNLSKSDSLYNDGMRILAFSARAKKEHNKGWQRLGTDISYF